MNILNRICKEGLAVSNTEAKRLLFQGRIRVNGEKIIIEESSRFNEIEVDDTDKIELIKSRFGGG